MFLEVLRVESDGQTRRCYGPFETEEARRQFKEGMESGYAELRSSEIFSKLCDVNRIKYIFCEFLPPGKWDKYPTKTKGIFLWVEDEGRRCFRVPPKYRE